MSAHGSVEKKPFEPGATVAYFAAGADEAKARVIGPARGADKYKIELADGSNVTVAWDSLSLPRAAPNVRAMNRIVAQTFAFDNLPIDRKSGEILVERGVDGRVKADGRIKKNKEWAKREEAKKKRRMGACAADSDRFLQLASDSPVFLPHNLPAARRGNRGGSASCSCRRPCRPEEGKESSRRRACA